GTDAEALTPRSSNRRCEFHKRSQLFIRLHNETLSGPRDVRLQFRSFARKNPRLRHNPNSNRVSLILRAMISQYFTGATTRRCNCRRPAQSRALRWGFALSNLEGIIDTLGW